MAKGPLCVLGCYILWGLLPIFWKRLAVSSWDICVNWGTFIWAVNNGHMLDSSLAY